MARILRGEIYWADLNPVRGSEQAGLRPVLILSHDVLNERAVTVVAVAITSQPQRAGFPLTLELSSPRLPKRSWVKISQIRTFRWSDWAKRSERSRRRSSNRSWKASMKSWGLDCQQEQMSTKEGPIAAERRLLQLLCDGAAGAELRADVLARLRGYAFRSVAHQVLFDCLQAMPMDRPELLRELLPARLVRAGFPEFDLAPFFESRGESPGESAGEPHALSAQEAKNLVEQLLATVPGRNSGID